MGQGQMGMRPMLYRTILLPVLISHARTQTIELLFLERRLLLVLGFIGAAPVDSRRVVIVGQGGSGLSWAWPDAVLRRSRLPRRWPPLLLLDGAGRLRRRRRALGVEALRRLARGRRRAGVCRWVTRAVAAATWPCGRRGNCPCKRRLVGAV